MLPMANSNCQCSSARLPLLAEPACQGKPVLLCSSPVAPRRKLRAHPPPPKARATRQTNRFALANQSVRKKSGQFLQDDWLRGCAKARLSSDFLYRPSRASRESHQRGFRVSVPLSPESGSWRLNMDNQTLNENCLKAAIVKVYADVVALHPNCEEGFRSLNEKDIRVCFENEKVTIRVPCLNILSEVEVCVLATLARVRHQFFIEEETPFISSSCPFRYEPNLRTDSGYLSWSCKVRLVKGE